MSSSYTPSNIVDMSKEKDWPANLGMLDWDSTSIVFTKRSLLEFLKYAGTTVDPNFTNIAKLPRYATFGKISVPPLETINPETKAPAVVAIVESQSASDAFKPTRRVRTVPGGPHSDIFGHDDDTPPPAPASVTKLVDVLPAQTPFTAAASISQSDLEPEEESGVEFGSGIKPSRRVRTHPGGNSSLANFWDSEETPEFKPTRRVRQGPGGQDHINDV